MDIVNTCFASVGEVRDLALYSHLIPATAILVLGLFAIVRAADRWRAMFFFGFVFTFAAWLVVDLLAWLANDYELLAALWAPLDFINIIFFLLTFCFVYSDTLNRPLSRWVGVFVTAAAAVPFYITVTGTAVHELYHPDCEMIGNSFLGLYKFSIELIVLFAALVLGIYRIVSRWHDKRERIRAGLISGSIFLFMGVFSFAEYQSVLTGNYEIMLYALFSLPIFILLLTIAITSFDTFRLGDAAVKVLFYVFLVLSGTQFFFIQDMTGFLLAMMSFGVILTLGVLLFISNAREIRLTKDLTVANERLKELDQMKSEFLSIASHQLRAPITAVKGYVSLIREGDYGVVPETMKEPLGNIAESVRIMVSSIEDYLNVSRIEQNRMKYEISDVDIADVAKKAVSELQPLADARKLALSISAPASISIRADIGKIKQVITNLIDNAIKYTEQGNVAVAVEQASDKVRITIKDTGVGIAAEDIGKLFQKFKRATGANEVNTSGTGLGLYVARLLVEGHGGKVWAESEGKGKGTCFIIELPLIQKTPAEPASSKVIPPPPRG